MIQKLPPLPAPTARQLRQMSPAERKSALESAAALAEAEYRENLDLTAFEAFGKGDLHGDSASAETR
jgi:hypothetical protein